MRVVWSRMALAHLAGIYQFISQTSRVYAELTVRRIHARGSQLEAFPESGREVPEYQDAAVRELIEPPYRIIYRISPTSIEVLAVVHARRAELL